MLRSPGKLKQLGHCLIPASVFRGKQRSLCTIEDVVDVAIVGAGVVGLAAARSLALAGREVVVLERGPSVGTETSSRNSEVIHAGIYYPSGSLKARCCVEGKLRLYEYCKSQDVPFSRLGKLLVATSPPQVKALDKYAEAAARNGVSDLERLSREEAASLEPALHCVAALLSPSTGIVDSHSLMQAYRADAEKAGAVFAFHSEVLGGSIQGPGFVLDVRDESTGETGKLGSRVLVNAGGLHSQSLASSLAGFPTALIPPLYLARGCYFSLTGRAPFSHLIYPMPEEGGHGLGTHLTLDLAGQAKFGPDVEWVDSIDYSVDPRRADSFYPAIRQYFPELPEGSLQPSYSGIRPKVAGPGEPAADFVVQGPREHGIKGLVNLFGIESPGLTASLELGDLVNQMVTGRASSA